jgi:PncC family amidohydrolase
VATAEATTGGLIGHLLTSIPGSSAVFRGGVAPYSNAMKIAIGVPPEILSYYGAVSTEAACALATAVREWSGADIGLAETGIAGPTGGTPERPVGSFWIAISLRPLDTPPFIVNQAPGPEGHPSKVLVTLGGRCSSALCNFDGDRLANQRAVAAALLRKLLQLDSFDMLTPGLG